jgi:hypothetical protein
MWMNINENSCHSNPLLLMLHTYTSRSDVEPSDILKPFEAIVVPRADESHL